jgi:hypothetical protein
MSLRRYAIRSNIQTHGLLWAVRHEEATLRRKGCNPERAIALAIAICTGRYL